MSFNCWLKTCFKHFAMLKCCFQTASRPSPGQASSVKTRFLPTASAKRLRCSAFRWSTAWKSSLILVKQVELWSHGVTKPYFSSKCVLLTSPGGQNLWWKTFFQNWIKALGRSMHQSLLSLVLGYLTHSCEPKFGDTPPKKKNISNLLLPSPPRLHSWYSLPPLWQ